MGRSSLLVAEEMMLLSNLIKQSHYQPLKTAVQIKTIIDSTKSAQVHPSANSNSQVEIPDVEQLKRRMIEDAEAHANQLIAQAERNADRMRQEAEAEIAVWWEQQREKDEAAQMKAKQQGYEQGYKEAEAAAATACEKRYEQKLKEASAVLEKAQQEKKKRIMEAELFLLELSCEIAAKLIDQQLSMDTHWHKDLVKKVLSKKREQGVITLCVAPESYSLLQDAREELLLALGPQSELQILPDLTVKDKGCIIRSAYGSIDARIDTQLQEVKETLLRIAKDSEESYVEQNVSG